MAYLSTTERSFVGEARARQQRSEDARPALPPEAARVARGLERRKVSLGLLFGLARLADLLVLELTGLLILWFYVAPSDPVGAHYVAALAFVATVTVLLVNSSQGYAFGAYRRPAKHVGRGAVVWIAVFGGFTLIVFFLKMGDEFSRVWLASWFVSGLAALTLNRLLLARLVDRWAQSGALERRAVLVGGGPEAVELIRALESQRENDIRICGIFDDRDDERVAAVRLGYPRLGRIEELVEFGRQVDVDLLIVALPLTAERRLVALLKKLWVLPVDIRLSVQSSPLRFRPRSYSYIGTVPFLDVFDKPIADWDSVGKRVFDVTIAALALIALAPLLLGAMIAVKLDSPGPVFFRQRRYGFNNELIHVLKLRSMYHHMADAEARKAVCKGDPRVTRVGRFLRRTSIDELPQLVNVLRGELSLVGPRPHAVAHNQLWEELVDGYFARHRVKPGVTGWAQVNGWRGEIDSEEKLRRRIEHDLAYIENWSVLFDLYILLLTPFRLLRSENAY